MSFLYAPIVGTQFAPPAKALLAALPVGFPLALRANPDNEYDQQAIEVELHSADLQTLTPEQCEALNEQLGAFATDLDSLRQQETWKLGHVGASGGKPMYKLRQVYSDIVGTEELHEAGLLALRCSLAALPSGEPTVVCELGA